MGTPRTPSQKKNYAALNERLTKYVAEVQRLYDELNSSICKDVLNAGYDGSSPFSFADYPELKNKLLDLQSDFVNGMKATIYRGTSEEWKNSNLVQDLLAKKVLTYYEDQVNGEKHKTYFQTNSDALKAFQERKDHGLNLSTKIWNQFPEYKKALEDTISTAIQRGTSAITLSKQVSQYLNDFPSMQKDYKERYGTASTAYDCEYRSIRLARSEINMAYRTAEQTRWRQFDFIKGYKICLSKSHKTKDVCDMLAGEYPKDFKWTGWHPNDMCYEVPIIASEEEYWNDVPMQLVNDVPNSYKLWVRNNEDRIANWSSLPYFLEDNPSWKDYLSLDYHKIADKKYDKADKEAQKTLLRQRYEKMIILSRKGKILSSTSGNVNNVYFNDETAKLAKDNIVLHNHPNQNRVYNDFRDVGHSFSCEDVNEAIKCDMFTFVALSPRYRFEMVRPATGWGVSTNEILKAYMEAFDAVRDEYKASFDNHLGWETIAQHLVMKRLAKKYKFLYTKKKIKK